MESNHVNFSLLPHGTQYQLFGKLNFDQWTFFDICSKYSNAFSKTYSGLVIPIHAHEITVQSGKFINDGEKTKPVAECLNLMMFPTCLYVEDPLDDEMCLLLLKHFRGVIFLNIKKSLTCSLELYTLVIKTLGVRAVTSRTLGTHVDFTNQDTFLERLRVLLIDDIHVETVFEMKAKELCIMDRLFNTADIMIQVKKLLLKLNQESEEFTKHLCGSFSWLDMARGVERLGGNVEVIQEENQWIFEEIPKGKSFLTLTYQDSQTVSVIRQNYK